MYALADETGRELRRYQNGCTNYYLSGLACACKRLEAGVLWLLERERIPPESVASVHIALAGIDTQADCERLEKGLAGTRLGGMPHYIENDLWIAFFSQTHERHGAVSICGTGHNTGVLRRDGRRVCIRASRYPLGNFGGGRMVCDMALNAAYMSSERTGEKTLLEERVAPFCGCESLAHLARRVIESRYTYQYKFPLPRLVEDLAMDGDAAACAILRECGQRQANMTGRLLMHMGMQHEALPIVLAGSLYCKGESSQMIAAYEDEIRSLCPNVYVQLLDREPVEGALRCAVWRMARGGAVIEA